MRKEENMYWFTTETGEIACNDFYGTFEKACEYAKRMIKYVETDIYINCGDDIVGVELW